MHILACGKKVENLENPADRTEHANFTQKDPRPGITFSLPLLHLLTTDDRLHIVAPLVMSVCEGSSPADKAVLASLSFQFGKLCSSLAGKLHFRGEGVLGALGASSDGYLCWLTASLQEEQKMLLLQRFKLLCVAGLEAEGNSMEGGGECTLIRCNCCYNLPVGSGMSNVRNLLG